MAHKYVLELAERVRRAVNLSAGPDEQLLGSVYLRVRKDASVCLTLARDGYEEVLEVTVERKIGHSCEEEVRMVGWQSRCLIFFLFYLQRRNPLGIYGLPGILWVWHASTPRPRIVLIYS